MFIKFLNYRLICLYFKNIKVLMRTFNMSLVGPVYACHDMHKKLRRKYHGKLPI